MFECFVQSCLTLLKFLYIADLRCRFYYADERKADGSVAGGAIDGDAHAEFYYELSQKKEQGPWQATFVKGTGYVDFN